MAVLYRLQPQAQTEPTLKLPSARELNGSARFELERARLQSVVARLGGPNGLFTGTFSPDMKALRSGLHHLCRPTTRPSPKGLKVTKMMFRSELPECNNLLRLRVTQTYPSKTSLQT